MDREAWQATVHAITKELAATEQQQQQKIRHQSLKI